MRHIVARSVCILLDPMGVSAFYSLKWLCAVVFKLYERSNTGFKCVLSEKA